MLFPYVREFTIPRTEDFTWDGKLTGQFTLPWELNLQVSGIYYAPKNIPQGKERARSSIDLGIRKKVFEGNGEISLSFSDILNRFGIRQEIEGDGFSVLYENYYETQIIRLGYKQKF
jgi:hypothetical protein